MNDVYKYMNYGIEDFENSIFGENYVLIEETLEAETARKYKLKELLPGLLKTKALFEEERKQ